MPTRKATPALDELTDMLRRLGSDFEPEAVATLLLEIVREKRPDPRSPLGTWVLQLAVDMQAD
jgi:hypothetical protein